MLLQCPPFWEGADNTPLHLLTSSGTGSSKATSEQLI